MLIYFFLNESESEGERDFLFRVYLCFEVMDEVM